MHQNTVKNNSNKFQQCRKLRRDFTDQETFIIVDGKKYFTFSGEETPGNVAFYSSNKENTPDDVKFKSKQKFEYFGSRYPAKGFQHYSLEQPKDLKWTPTSILENIYQNY